MGRRESRRWQSMRHFRACAHADVYVRCVPADAGRPNVRWVHILAPCLAIAFLLFCVVACTCQVLVLKSGARPGVGGLSRHQCINSTVTVVLNLLSTCVSAKNYSSSGATHETLAPPGAPPPPSVCGYKYLKTFRR